MSDASDISNKVLQASLAELISVLTSLFNACVTHKYHLKQFKKIQTIILCKSKKSDYIDSVRDLPRASQIGMSFN